MLRRGCPTSKLRPILRKINMSNVKRVSEVRTSQREPEREQRIFTFRACQLIWVVFVLLEALMALRIGLKLINANPDTPIVALIYNFTSLFLFPFTGLIGTLSPDNIVLEFSLMFVLLIYAAIAWKNRQANLFVTAWPNDRHYLNENVTIETPYSDG